ncbi:MAG: helix-turn-helix transcriptional regulator [Flavobacteriales bacterium]|nr:helix-turn-helix transcriptional regulator [Flavobacteriales bacterium]
MSKSVIQRMRERISPETKRMVAKNLAICEQVRLLLAEKGLTQKDLAERMGKSPAEVSKWLSGLHNLTQQSIVKMEEALGADITITPEQAKHMLPDVRMVPVPAYATPSRKHFSMESCTDAEPMNVGKANNGMKLVA